MDKIKIILGALVLALHLVPTSSTATSITRNVLIDLEADGSVTAFANQDSWEGTVSIEDTTFTTGDTVLIKIRFKN